MPGFRHRAGATKSSAPPRIVGLLGHGSRSCHDRLVLRRRLGLARLAVTLALSLSAQLMVARIAHGSNPYLEVPPGDEFSSSPAYRYANMTNDAAQAEIDRRRLPFAPETEPIVGVRLPGRLTGPMHGVWIHGTIRGPEATTVPFEILDGRLALALDDFCRVLAAHGIDELVHFSIYRPPPRASASDGFLFRHSGALAIDVASLRRSDGTWLRVEKDWPSAPGARTCGPSGRWSTEPNGRELQSLVCEAKDLRLFHYALTPHYNRAHFNHVHLEIKPGVNWLLYN